MATANPTAIYPPARRPLPSRRWFLLAGVLLLFAPLAYRRSFTCAVCGMDRTEVYVFRVLVTRTDAKTDCSAWYSVNVEPHHDHVWVRDTWSNAYTLCGICFVGLGSNSSGRAEGPLVRFGSRSRLSMYQACPDPLLLRTAFLRLSRWERESTKRREEQIEIEHRLAAFETTGRFPEWPIVQPE